MRGGDRAGRSPGPRAWIGIDPYCVAYSAFLNPVRYSGICDLRCRTLLPQLALDTHRNEVAATLQTSEGLCVNEVTLMDCRADDVGRRNRGGRTGLWRRRFARNGLAADEGANLES